MEVVSYGASISLDLVSVGATSLSHELISYGVQFDQKFLAQARNSQRSSQFFSRHEKYYLQKSLNSSSRRNVIWMISPSIKNFVCCSRKFKCMCMFLSTGIGALSLSTKPHNSGSPDILDFPRPNWIFLFPKKELNTNLAYLSLSTSKAQFSKLQDIHIISPTRLRTMTWTNVF